MQKTPISLVKLDTPNLHDCVEMIHRLANECENRKDIVHVLVVLETDEGKLDIRGYGEVSDIARETGILYGAAIQLSLGNL